MAIANAINAQTAGIQGMTSGGVWNGTPVTNHALIVGGSTSSTLSNVGPTATAGQVLQSAGASADPAFSTATYPATATGTGTILRADGTNWVATTSTYPNTNAISTLLYASASNVMSALATANSGVLITNSSGVPSISNQLTISNTTNTLATLTSTDAGATAGPIIDLYRNSASPAAADILGSIPFNGVDSGAAKQEYARIESVIISTTAGSEKGELDFYTTATGTSTKQVALLDTGGQYRGNNTNTAPPAGYIGEQIRATVALGSAVGLTNTVAANITSISLTAGIWDVSALIIFPAQTCTGTAAIGSISTTSATNGTYGDNRTDTGYMPTTTFSQNLTIPSYRLTLSTTTTTYLVVQANFTAGTCSAFGRLSATRVG